MRPYRRAVEVGSETREDTILRLSEELVMWHAFKERCAVGKFLAGGSYTEDIADLSVTMDERTVEKWKSFAMSMIDHCNTRLRELTI